MAAIAATMSASVTMVRPELSGEAQNSIIYDILSEVFEVTEGFGPKLPIFRPDGQREQALRSDIGLWVVVAEEYGMRAATIGYFTARSISWQLEWDYNYEGRMDQGLVLATPPLLLPLQPVRRSFRFFYGHGPGIGGSRT